MINLNCWIQNFYDCYVTIKDREQRQGIQFSSNFDRSSFTCFFWSPTWDELNSFFIPSICENFKGETVIF